MIDVKFDDLQSEILSILNSARESVKIAVAWINFEVYKKEFIKLLRNGVKLKIIINNDFINARYNSIIEELRLQGAKIKKFQMATSKQYMHEKFVIIDSKYVCFGSYNWSKNANKNFEYIAFCDEENVIQKFKYEFKCLSDLSKKDIVTLQKPKCCEKCNTPIYNIAVISQNGYYSTKFEVYRECGCGFELDNRYTDYYDISLYGNLYGIYENFENYQEQLYYEGIELNEAMMENALNNLDIQIISYLSSLRHSAGDINIHAIGVYANRDTKYDDGGIYVNILWKDKFVMAYIDDEYEL